MHWGAIGQWDVSCQCKSKPESPLGIQSAFQATPDIWQSWGCVEAVAGVCLKDEWKAEVDRYHAVWHTVSLILSCKDSSGHVTASSLQRCARGSSISRSRCLSWGGRGPSTWDTQEKSTKMSDVVLVWIHQCQEISSKLLFHTLALRYSCTLKTLGFKLDSWSEAC